MNDITHKIFTLRVATAQAIVRVSKPETMLAIKNKTVPKGDVFEMAKAASLLAIKKTSDVIPDCHPMPIEGATVKYETNSLELKILVDVKTIYKTGVEVEAMHGASVAALTIYDMLKPIDKGVEIHHIKLVEKIGRHFVCHHPLGETYSDEKKGASLNWVGKSRRDFEV
jgi:molybdenum cofactor biosynthesis protein MoaC